jgi:lysophospholipase L1-like esterase
MMNASKTKGLAVLLVVGLLLSGAAEATAAGLDGWAAKDVALQQNEKIAFLGDSITQGGAGKGGYCRLIDEAITKCQPQRGVQFVYAGISGHKVPDLQGRLDRDVLSKKPTVVWIFIGINDVWHSEHGRGTAKDKYEAGLRDLLKRIQDAGATPILATPSVIGEKTDGSNKLDGMLEEYSAISRKVASDMGVHLCDLRAAFLAYLKKNNPENKDRGILTSDRVHLNAAGNRFVAEQASEAIIQALKKRKPAGTATAAADGFQCIFDGKTLQGWHVSSKTGHGTGGRWVVEDGAITGSQDKPGNGGIILTDKQYGNFEVVLEMKNDFGPDSGLFLRSTERGQAYQAMIDYHGGGNLMGIYGEGLSGGIGVSNFHFTNKVTEIVPNACPFPLPVSPAKWPEFWKHGQWNELRARIEGNPPKISTWINGVKFMEWSDKEKRHPDTGGIALQVHGGGDYTKQFVRYRNIRVKEL